MNKTAYDMCYYDSMIQKNRYLFKLIARNTDEPFHVIKDYMKSDYRKAMDRGNPLYLNKTPKQILGSIGIRIQPEAGINEKYDEFMDQYGKIVPYLLKAKEQYEDRCAKMAAEHKDTDYHMVVGSGMLWGEAYDYAMCILEEMQWIKTKSIHAAEYFHGTLELVEDGTSMILFYGEDETRPLMDRVMAFSKKITSAINVFDTKEVELPFTEQEYRKIVSPMIMYAITERLSCHLEKERNHPLTTRRYYRQMEY